MEETTLGDFGADDGDRLAEAEAVAGTGAGGAEVVDPTSARYPEADGRVTLAITQVDYTIEGYGDEERPVIHVFGRTDDDEAEHVRVHGFRPYFYAPTATLDPGDLDHDAITGSEAGYESIRGESLTRIYGRTPRDVGNVRDRFDHYEADILFPNRFLIDTGIRSGLTVPERRAGDGDIDVPYDEVEPAEATADLRVNTFDIEVEDRSGFPEDGEEPIVCLTSHDSYEDEYVVWLYEAPDATAPAPDSLSDYEPYDEGATHEVRTFETETAMLDAFLEYLDATGPDVLTGWNFDDFDAPYLVDRLEELDMDPGRLSPIGEVWGSNYGGPDVKGRVVFDLLYAYDRTQFSELDSYRLDAVAEIELGVGKERYTGDIGDLWEQDPERLLEYNLRDVELCVEIDRKQEVIPFWEEVASFVGCKLEDATTPGDAVDMYVLHEVHGEYALPSKGRRDGEEYEGGAVFDPITGVRENVTVLDLKSLYPMCMVTINASPETKVDPAAYDGETYVAPNGTHFRTEPDGVIRAMVDDLLAERERKKSRRDDNDPDSAAYERYDRQQAAVKVIMNSLYGVLGWDRFRLYDEEMGAAVTATGREVIEYTDAVVEREGYEVVYGDTDSVMLEIRDVGPEDVAGDVTVTDDLRAAHPEMDEAALRATAATIEKGFELESLINDSYDEFAREELGAEDHRFQIEFEKLYRRFFQAGKKKRYAGHVVWSEGKHVDDVDITGFEYKRSDIAPITKEVQREVIDMIVRGAAIDDVTEYVHGVIEEFRDGAVSLDEVGIPGGIGKRLDNYDTDTAQVRGAKYANLLLDTNFQRGSKPKRVYLEKVHPDFFRRIEADRGLDPQTDPLYRDFKSDPDVICFEYADQVPPEFAVDWDRMLEKTLRGPIARVLEALDVSWEEVRSGQEQRGLESFM